MIKISGLDKLTRTLDQAQKAMAELDGELGGVRFSPDDPESIEQAIAEMEQLVDSRLGPYLSNPIVGPMAAQMKAAYRKGIIDKAAEARLEGDTD